MKKLYLDILKNIELNLLTQPRFNDPSLYIGLSGGALFTYYYGSYIEASRVTPVFEKSIESITEMLPFFKNETFCNGRSGIHWLLSFLYNRDMLYLKDKRILCDQYDDNLKIKCENMLEEQNFDFLHGSLGLYYYLLYNNGPDNFKDLFYSNYIDNLSSQFLPSKFGNFIPTEFSSDGVLNIAKINLGLSHGLPSILKILCECYRKGISKTLSKKRAYDIIECMLMCKNKNTTLSYFPSSIDLSVEQNSESSRLGWCYGDLGAAYTLYQAGKIFIDEKVENLALEILEKSTHRKNPQAVGLSDMGICHGMAGVVYIYFKLWKETKLASFKLAADYWLSHLVTPAKHNNFAPYFQKYTPAQKYTETYSLLEGAVGIGMVLLSFLTEDTDWDYCLMLNN